MRQKEKKSLYCICNTLYRNNMHRFFITWRIKTTIFVTLLQKNTINHCWYKWKQIFQAKRQYKYTVFRRIFSAWKAYYYSIDTAKLVLLKRRRIMWKLLIK